MQMLAFNDRNSSRTRNSWPYRLCTEVAISRIQFSTVENVEKRRRPTSRSGGGRFRRVALSLERSRVSGAF